MADFTKLFEQIKATNLVKDSDLLICHEAPNPSAYYWGGLIGAAISEDLSSTSHFVLAFENDTIYLFDIDVFNAKYLGTVIEIPFTDIKRIGISTFITKEIYILTKQKTSLRVVFSNKYHPLKQKEAIKRTFKALKDRKKRK
ncbi:MAG: hypothetical protein J1F32_04005 [Erysipelotrichales bacterium]|nr:hypothetical protein [Erysipelotrichales bacterium]